MLIQLKLQPQNIKKDYLTYQSSIAAVFNISVLFVNSQAQITITADQMQSSATSAAETDFTARRAHHDCVPYT